MDFLLQNANMLDKVFLVVGVVIELLITVGIYMIYKHYKKK